MVRAKGPETPRFLIVGAGLTGAVIARVLADAGLHCDVIDEAAHVAGHCFTSRDPQTGIMMHRYGPHTLHTDREDIWTFLERFCAIHPYQHRKVAWSSGRAYPMPLNLDSLNAFFETTLTPETAPAFLKSQAESLGRSPANFEEAGLSTVGRRLFDAFYRGYTVKQWGREPSEIPAYVFGRVPVHFNYNRNVFYHTRQGQPVGGYTRMVEHMLDHPGIRLQLGRSFDPMKGRSRYRQVFYSGPIDRFFAWRFGRLLYRTLEFVVERGTGYFQECGTVNQCDMDVPYTRVAEHKHFSPWENHEDTVYSFEYSRECSEKDDPYYPIHFAAGNQLYDRYVDLARKEKGVSFVGRLGTYRYLDMDVAIGEALDAAAETLNALGTEAPLPPFFAEPLRRQA